MGDWFDLKTFIGTSDNWRIQLLRYSVVGGISFVLDYSLLYILTQWGNIHYLLSATISFTVGLMVNYLISIKWVFDRSILQNRMMEFFIFAFIGLVGLLINDLLIYYFTDHMHFYYMLSKLGAALIVLIWNFVMRKIILFK